ncbi:MAG: hypothetical protein ABSH34_11360 [Verrucomicrobiota bacterium]
MILTSGSKRLRFRIWTSGLALSLGAAFAAPGQLPVMKRSDVVFMYEAGRQTYEDYGATVLAWGGKPTPKALEQARGLKFFGSVGMVTEFGRYYERFPQTYQQGLCRGLDGQPYKVPWLTDLQHKGIPFWWCCTRQPLFRQYVSERVVETVKAGAEGVHIDDHLGTAGALWSGGCFCDRCVEEFHDYLKALPASELARQGIQDPAGFNYRTVLQEWLAQKRGRKAQEHPLWSQWRIYQLQGAARFMEELRALAARTAGHTIPMGANAGLLWGNHLNDFKALDLFSAEIEHHASDRHFSDAPLVAYRLADAVGRPLASTASGWDWAYIKEHNLPGLVQGWIALSYAAGHGLMVPNRQWCYTPEKGTHWYEGPKEKFAPLFQFVRQHSSLFDDYRNYADLTVVFSSRTFDRNPARLIAACGELAAANVSYCLALSGDEVVDHPLKAGDLRLSPRLVVIEPQDLSGADREVLGGEANVQRYATIRQAIAGIAPAVRVKAPAAVRVLPRVKPGSAIVHLANWGYDAGNDSVQPLKNVLLDLDLEALGVAGATEADLFSPGAQPLKVPVTNRSVTVPELGLWSVVEICGSGGERPRLSDR